MQVEAAEARARGGESGHALQAGKTVDQAIENLPPANWQLRAVARSEAFMNDVSRFSTRIRCILWSWRHR